MTRDEFASLVSHELRNPLNAMSGWLHLLAADPGLRSDGAQRALAGLRRAIDQQLRQIDVLGRVMRLADGGTIEALEPVDLGATLDACADALRPAAQAAGRAVEVVRDGAPAWHAGDRGALLSALTALGAFGLRHGLPGAPLVLALERDGDGDGATTIRIGIDEGDDGGLSIWHGIGAGNARLPLELLLATLVIEAHGARVGPSGDGRAGDVLAMRFGPAPAGRPPGDASPARPHA